MQPRHQRDALRPHRLAHRGRGLGEQSFAVIAVRGRRTLGALHQEEGRAEQRRAGFAGDGRRHRQARLRREYLDHPILPLDRRVLIDLMPARFDPQHPAAIFGADARVDEPGLARRAAFGRDDRAERDDPQMRERSARPIVQYVTKIVAAARHARPLAAIAHGRP
nr:hypothetical protein [Sphingopyxis sp. PET50]